MEKTRFFASWLIEVFTRSVLSNSLYRNIFLFWIMLFSMIHFQFSSFSGYSYSPPPFIWYLFQLVLLFILSRLLPAEINGPVQILQVMLAIFLTVPIFILTFTNSINTIQPETKWVVILLVLLVHYLISKVSALFPDSSRLLYRKSLTDTQILYVLLILSVFLSTFVVVVGKLQFTITSFADLYEMRAKFVQELTYQQSPYVSYGIGWLGGILTSLLFFFSVYKKNFVFAAFSLVVAIGIYTGAYQKWVLGTFPFIILMFLIARNNQGGKLITIRVFKYFSLLVFLFHLIKSLTGLQVIIDLPVRRAILDPAVMFQYYIQYAQEYDLQYWSDSNISRLFGSEPKQTVAQIIGERYFNIPDYLFLERRPPMNATSGMLADGVGQAGFIGLLLSTLIMFVFFWFLSLLSKGRNFTIVFVISSLAFILLMEGALHTGMLSRGLVLIPIVMYFLPRVEVPPKVS